MLQLKGFPLAPLLSLGLDPFVVCLSVHWSTGWILLDRQHQTLFIFLSPSPQAPAYTQYTTGAH